MTTNNQSNVAREAGRKIIVPTMFSDGLSIEQFNSLRGDEIADVQYRGFSSHGFFRGSLRFPGDPEFTQVFSSASDDALAEWNRNKAARALNLAMRRMLCAEATVRNLNKLAA